MKRSEKQTVSRLLWADRCNRIRVVLDSYYRRGERTVRAPDVARVADVTESAVRRIGLKMVDRIQFPGAKVRYAVALFFLDKAE